MRKETFIELAKYDIILGLIRYSYIVFAFIAGALFKSTSIILPILFIPFALYFVLRLRWKIIKFEKEFDANNGVFNYRRRLFRQYINYIAVEFIALAFLIAAFYIYSATMLLYLLLVLSIISIYELLGHLLLVYAPFVGTDD